ncbi:MAG TPA: ACT domain-containing protein [Acidimicrobiales bacterium]|nr:ACT domain-containing protein [Acidimicrobiales bacterium]
MGNLLRLRIQLADRAGALGQAATVIGLHGGNIVFIDIHRTEGPSAVDDLVVEFGEPPDIDVIAHDLTTNAATSLLSFEPAESGDPLVRGLLLLSALSDGDDATDLAEAVAAISHAQAAWVADAEGASRFEAGKLAIENGQAVVEPASAVPAELAHAVSGDAWLAAVPEPPGAADRKVAFVVGSGEVPFTATEIQRIEALLSARSKIVSNR